MLIIFGEYRCLKRKQHYCLIIRCSINILNVVLTTRFWNKHHQVRSISLILLIRKKQLIEWNEGGWIMLWIFFNFGLIFREWVYMLFKKGKTSITTNGFISKCSQYRVQPDKDVLLHRFCTLFRQSRNSTSHRLCLNNVQNRCSRTSLSGWTRYCEHFDMKPFVVMLVFPFLNNI
jgi:hypothetical protein